MNRDDPAFLRYISAYCAEYPDVIPALIPALTGAITTRLSEEAEKRAKIESALCMSLMRRSKSANMILADKLKEIEGFGMLRYDGVIKELKEKT